MKKKLFALSITLIITSCGLKRPLYFPPTENWPNETTQTSVHQIKKFYH
ncbi:LPS translocon maturation chaperone LptM [Candidatus Williamhamiltonella defendens]|nr:lipoprotein [Candidatus Hamiltonella defensa]